MSGDFAKCLSAGYVEAWQTVMLRFTGPVPLLPPVEIPVSEVNPILVDHDGDHGNDDSRSLDDRIECFQSAAEALAHCGSFQEVQEAARTMKDIVDGFFIPLPCQCDSSSWQYY